MLDEFGWTEAPKQALWGLSALGPRHWTLHPGKTRVPVRDREVVPIVVGEAEAAHLKKAISEIDVRRAMVALLRRNTLPSRGGRGRRNFWRHLLGSCSGTYF